MLLCKLNVMIMRNKNWHKTVLVMVTCTIIILQAVSASFAQTKMSLTALEGANANIVIICTPEGFKTINWSGPGAPLEQQNIDCACPACAFLGTDRLSGIIIRIAHVTRKAISADTDFAAYHVRPTRDRLNKPDKARSPPFPS